MRLSLFKIPIIKSFLKYAKYLTDNSDIITGVMQKDKQIISA